MEAGTCQQYAELHDAHRGGPRVAAAETHTADPSGPWEGAPALGRSPLLVRPANLISAADGSSLNRRNSCGTTRAAPRTTRRTRTVRPGREDPPKVTAEPCHGNATHPPNPSGSHRPYPAGMFGNRWHRFHGSILVVTLRRAGVSACPVRAGGLLGAVSGGWDRIASTWG